MLKNLFLFFNLLIQYHNIYSTKIDIITDVHANPGETPHEINSIKNNVKDSDFVMYLGDLFNSVKCPILKKCNLPNQIDAFVTKINKPFLFTLGNHDGTGKIRNELIERLQNHPLHLGICNHRGKACRHLDLNIFTLDSNTNGCDNEHSYGCPYKEDVEWVNQNLNKYNHSFIILFTHIPPPNVLGLKAHGINDERPCCWNVKDNTTLPNKKPLFHVFGHDHNNLYITEKYNGTQYVNALKTGDHRSYGPDFANSGITRLLISDFVPSIQYSRSLNGNVINRYDESININYSYCGGSGEDKKNNFDKKKSLEVIIIVASCIVFVYIVFLSYIKYQDYKRRREYGYYSLN